SATSGPRPSTAARSRRCGPPPGRRRCRRRCSATDAPRPPAGVDFDGRPRRLTAIDPSRIVLSIQGGSMSARQIARGVALLGWLLAARAFALPDLVPEIFNVGVDANIPVNPEDVVEGCAGGDTGRMLVGFSLRTRNIGPDDLALGDPQCPDCSTHPGV